MKLFPDIPLIDHFQDILKIIIDAEPYCGKIGLYLRIHSEIGYSDQGLVFANAIYHKLHEPLNARESKDWFQGLRPKDSIKQDPPIISPLRERLFQETWNNSHYLNSESLGYMFHAVQNFGTNDQIRDVVISWFLQEKENFSLTDVIEACLSIFKIMKKEEQVQILEYLSGILKTKQKNTQDYLVLATYLYDWFFESKDILQALKIKHDLIEEFSQYSYKEVEELWDRFSLKVQHHEGSEECLRISLLTGLNVSDILQFSDIMKQIRNGEMI